MNLTQVLNWIGWSFYYSLAFYWCHNWKLKHWAVRQAQEDNWNLYQILLPPTIKRWILTPESELLVASSASCYQEHTNKIFYWGCLLHLFDSIWNRFYNTNVERNMEQHIAVQHIVSGLSRPAPYLIYGPPGTGKTMTLVEAIKQVWRICAAITLWCQLCHSKLSTIFSYTMFHVFD